MLGQPTGRLGSYEAQNLIISPTGADKL